MNLQLNSSSSPYISTIVEHMPVGVALYDAKTLCLLAANTLFQSSMSPSWQNGRAIGHPITDWLPDAEVSRLVTIFRNVVETGLPYRTDEYTFPSNECTVLYWNWTLNPIFDTDGHVIQLVHTAYDITTQVLARQQAEQAQTSLNQMNSMVETERKRLDVIETVARCVRESLDPERISIATIDAIQANFHVKYVYAHIADPIHNGLRLIHIAPPPKNIESVRLLQYIPPDSLLPSAQAHTQREPIVIEDLQDPTYTMRLGAQHPLISGRSRGYICVPLWSGDMFEGTLAATFPEPIVANAPELQALVGCGTHLAAALAHARLHARVEHERARLHAVLDQLPEGILIVEGTTGSIIYANDAAASILGTAQKKLVGVVFNRQSQASIKTKQHKHNILPWNFAVTRALAGATINGQETAITRPDGSTIVILSTIAPFRKEDGSITDAIIVFQDITAQKSVEEQKKEFLSIASHELRTPTTAIQGFAELLQMQMEAGKSLDTPHAQRALENIVAQSEHLSLLIDEMLDISRIEYTQLKLDIAPHDFIATISQIVETQAAIAKRHRLRLVLLDLAATDTLTGMFDENRIKQVFNNLISNAIKYSPHGEEIEIGLRAIPSEVQIWVTDHGIGIPTHHLPLVFNRFHRATNIDKSISGMGIGLYLVKELVARHGGRVWVTSTEEQGSTFYVTLPLKKP